MSNNLFQLVAPLDRFSDHRTYSAAVNAIHRVLRTEGRQAAERKSAEITELYEELYLTEAVD